VALVEQALDCRVHEPDIDRHCWADYVIAGSPDRSSWEQLGDISLDGVKIGYGAVSQDEEHLATPQATDLLSMAIEVPGEGSYQDLISWT